MMSSSRFSIRQAALSLALLLVSSLIFAQNRSLGPRGPSIHGVPPSVTSFGFGGTRGPRGIAPSVTSLGFGNTGFRLRSPRCCFHRPRPAFIHPFYGLGYYVPYFSYADPLEVIDPGVDDSMEEDSRGGLTIFDRGGQGPRDYVRALRHEEGARADSTPTGTSNDKPGDEAAQSVEQQPKTVLVFRDGHELEVSNYAIVGATLYDLAAGHTRKVALAELDLAATVKQNDQNGVEFRLPNGVKLN